MAEIFKWKFIKTSNYIQIEGVVYGHGILYDMSLITTSTIKSLNLNRDSLKVICVTNNTEYSLSLFELNVECSHKTIEDLMSLLELEANDDLIRTIKDYYDSYEANRMQKVNKLFAQFNIDGILSLGANREWYFNYFAHRIGDEVCIQTKVRAHIGTFQDSVIIRNSIGEAKRADLRYFPYQNNKLSFYNFDLLTNQGLRNYLRIYVENIGRQPLSIGTKWGYSYMILPKNSMILSRRDLEFGMKGSITGKELYPAIVLEDDDIKFIEFDC